MINSLLRFRTYSALLAVAVSASMPALAQSPIVHQISLPAGETWCDDVWIYAMFSDINALRAKNNLAPLTMDTLGMKDAEIRATQVIDYFSTNPPGSPGFFPHLGYDTTAASLGYNLVTENLAWAIDPYYIVYTVWNDPAHMSAMLSTQANVAGVSCVATSIEWFWTFEPGIAASAPAPPPSTPPTTPVLDTYEAAFLALINTYRAQLGSGPLQVSTTLQNAAVWKSNDMGVHNLTGHVDSLGRDTAARLAAFNYPYSPWGENIAGGFDDAQSVFNGWLTACDPDPNGSCTYAHRTNMQSAAFVAIGIGRVAVPGSAYGR